MRILSILLMLLTLSINVSAADFFSKELFLSANIKRSGFFSYSIREMFFDKTEYRVNYNELTGTFEDIDAKLNIISTVPVSMTNVGYFIEMIAEESTCSKLGIPGPIPLESFTHYSLDSKEIELNTPVEFDSFGASTDGFYSALLNMTIKFDKVDESIAMKTQCQGNATFIAGLTL
ncbi:hypothetical protein J7G16_004592 [Vibrio parahaemolyticus]|nr:hypothetical protein [Vibrio parahaemolyticus]